MYSKRAIGSSLILSLLAATGAAAQTLTKYGEEAGWEIYVRGDMGPGCLIMKDLTDSLQLQMGIDATNEARGYLALYTTADAAIAGGDKISVLFDVDGQEFSGEATGQQVAGVKGAFARLNNPDFIYDLAKKKFLTIKPAGRDAIVVSLAGTNAAMKALRTCQDAQ
jgi:hypothetical protein